MLNTKNENKSSKAFTLIELLVVIAIIALLLSIVMPSLRRARNLAHRVICTSNQRSIAVASIAYMSEHDNHFMHQHAQNGWAIPHALSSGQSNWIQRVWPYIDSSKKVFRCPSNKWRKEEQSNNVYYPNEDEEFSYVANGVIAHFGRLQRTPPASVVAVFDDYDNSNGAILRPHYRGVIQADGSIPYGANGWVGWMWYNDGRTKLSALPHEGRVNAFLDGSANWYREDDLTSRKYGLLINGMDTFEPEGGSYDDQGRWGVAIVR